ncbi:MAG: SDR family oxidoreductase [Acetobacteraceae bacterium]|nr:SDR family oxidoreductase [Acetobacteraceae bacterium]
MHEKAALVTGAARGIGRATAVELARQGAGIALLDIADPDAIPALKGYRLAGRAELEEATRLVRAEGVRALPLVADLRDREATLRAGAQAAEAFGGLDILVANAGIAIMVQTVDMTLEQWRRQMAVNVEGVFLAVKHAIPAMRRAGGRGCSVVLMSSVAGLRGSAGLAGYSATKGAVGLFAMSVAMECAAARDGVRVNSVHPGIIDTAIWEKMPAGLPEGRNTPLDARAVAAEGVPLGEPGQASDVADGVLFLASDASRHMTGSELVIDGGMTAGRVGNIATAPAR